MEKLQRKISRLYFHHGQFCATYPAPIILVVIFIILLFCYPLTYISLPKNAPFDYSALSEKEYRDTNASGRHTLNSSHRLGFVVQVILRATVSPWEGNRMRPLDSLRAPLWHSLELHRLIQEFETAKRSLADLCMQVGEAGGDQTGPLLPSFSCLMLSPALIWRRDDVRFRGDSDLLKTLHRSSDANMKDLLFGLPWKSTGISRYFIRNYQRVISFAVTVLLKEYDTEFLDALKARLEVAYPLSSSIATVAEPRVNMIFYKEKNYFTDYTPLAITYIVLLLYMYFSVRKIEMVKSKWGLAISACCTVVFSLFMSIGICVYIGLMPTLNGSEIFPYLVVLIGLENVLVITKSVVATPVDLPVKDRIAHGLSKEGWAITKNLVTELLLLAIGFFTFNPAIQEFCLFAVVGLTTDFFLQMFFFVTVLSIDVRRMELSDLDNSHQAARRSLSCSNDNIQMFTFPNDVSPATPSSPLMPPSPVPLTPVISPVRPDFRGHKRKASDINTAAFIQSDGQVPVYVPRRLRFLYFWAKTRMFQRVIMFLLGCWIVMIVYTTGLYRPVLSLLLDLRPSSWRDQDLPPLSGSSRETEAPGVTQHTVPISVSEGQGNGTTAVLTPLQDMWKVMAYYHWPVLARYYNITLSGMHLTVLPPIHLALVVPPEQALRMQRADDSQGEGGVGGSSESMWEPPIALTLLPRSFSGWADAWLTAGMMLTCLMGVSCVMSTTYVIMCLFQWIQARSRRRRPGRVRILPLILPTNCEGCVEMLACGDRHVTAGSPSGPITVWRLDTGEKVADIERQYMERQPDDKEMEGSAASTVWCLALARDIVFLGCSNGCVEAWSFLTSRLINSVEVDRTGITKMVLCDRSLYAVTFGGLLAELAILDTSACTPGQPCTALRLSRSLRAHHHPINDLHVASGCLVTAGEDLSVKVFSLVNLDLQATIHSAQDSVLCVHLEKNILVLGCADGSIHVHDLKSGSNQCLRHSVAVSWVRVTPFGAILSCDLWGTLCLWRTGRQRPIRQYNLCEQAVLLPAPACLIGNGFLYGDQGQLRMVNLETHVCEKALLLLSSNSAHNRSKNAFTDIVPVALTEDSRFIVCVCRDKIIVMPSSVVQ